MLFFGLNENMTIQTRDEVPTLLLATIFRQPHSQSAACVSVGFIQLIISFKKTINFRKKNLCFSWTTKSVKEKSDKKKWSCELCFAGDVLINSKAFYLGLFIRQNIFLYLFLYICI